MCLFITYVLFFSQLLTDNFRAKLCTLTTQIILALSTKMTSIEAILLETTRTNQIRKQNQRNVAEIRKEVRDLKEKKDRLIEEENDLDGTNNILQTKIEDANNRLFSIMNQEKNNRDSVVSSQFNHNHRMNTNDLVKKLEIGIEIHSELTEKKNEQKEKIDHLKIAKKARKLLLNDIAEETEKIDGVYQLLMKNKEIRTAKSLVFNSNFYEPFALHFHFKFTCFRKGRIR